MRRTLSLDDIDAAGVAFGPRLITLAHHAVEQALAGTALDLPAMLRGGLWAMPIVEIGATFHHPLRHGDVVDFAVTLRALSERSVTLCVQLMLAGTCAAEVRQTQVCLDRATRRAVAWPPELRQAWAAVPATPCASNAG